MFQLHHEYIDLSLANLYQQTKNNRLFKQLPKYLGKNYNQVKSNLKSKTGANRDY